MVREDEDDLCVISHDLCGVVWHNLIGVVFLQFTRVSVVFQKVSLLSTAFN
jgi:hypothetical protein